MNLPFPSEHGSPFFAAPKPTGVWFLGGLGVDVVFFFFFFFSPLNASVVEDPSVPSGGFKTSSMSVTLISASVWLNFPPIVETVFAFLS